MQTPARAPWMLSLVSFAALGVGACGGQIRGSTSTDGPVDTAATGSATPGAGTTTTDATTLSGYADAVGQDDTTLYVATGLLLQRVDKDTLQVSPLTSLDSNIGGIAVDDTHVYFTMLVGDGGEVQRVPKSGGAVETIATRMQHPVGIAVDVDTVYWTDIGTYDVSAPGNDGVIRSIPKTGGEPTVLATGEQLPWSIALDDTSVVWGNTVWGGTNGSVRRVDKRGGIVKTLAANVDPSNVGITGGKVYWQGELGIRSMPLAGGALTSLTSYGDPGQGAFAVDSTGAYFGNWGVAVEGAVRRVALDGGPVDTVESASAPAPDAVIGATTFVLLDQSRVFGIEYRATRSAGVSTIVHRISK